MGVHDSHRTDYYWRNDSNQGSVHMPQFYINQTHFERLKRYLHISDPRERNSLRQLPKSVEELNKKNGDIRLNHWPSAFIKLPRNTTLLDLKFQLMRL